MATALLARLRAEGVEHLEQLDGDEVREVLSSGLGFSRADRDLNVARIGWVAATLATQGVVVLASVVSPFAAARQAVRSRHEARGVTFLEVHLTTPVEVCSERDVKGLYARQRGGAGSSWARHRGRRPRITCRTRHDGGGGWPGVADGATRPARAAGAAGVAVWAAASSVRADGLLPGPQTVAAETGRLLLDGGLLPVVGGTLATMAVGFTASAVVGIALGLLLAARPLADRAASPYLIGLQSLPSAVWIPVAVLFLGASSRAVLSVTVLGALPSITIGTRDAVHAIPPLLLRAARTLGARRSTLLLRVVVPAALPGIVSGLEHGWAFAFRSLVAGELLLGVAGSGLGSFVSAAGRAGRVDQLLASIVVILVIGVAVDRFGFARVQHRLRVDRGLTSS